MGIDQAVIQVIGEHECPYYKVDDEFNLSGHAVYMPCEKPACMMLLDDIRRIQPRISEQNTKFSFYCSGCTGLIKMDFEVKETDISACTGLPEKPEIQTMAELLSQIPVFPTLKKESLKYLIPFFKHHPYNKDDILIRKGQKTTNLFILVSGEVEIVDENIVIATLGKGEVFGEMSLISGDPAAATVCAKTSGSYLYIDGKLFRRIFNRFPQFQLYLLRMLARKLAILNRERVRDFSTVFSGNLSEIRPSELFQALNINQKTGELFMNLSKGRAVLCFKDGEVVSAEYHQTQGCDAFFEILGEQSGRFSFSPVLPADKRDAEKIGDMMWLLVMGSHKIEQSCDSPEQN